MRRAPALRKVGDIHASGAAAPKATDVIPLSLTIVATARLTRLVGSSIFDLSLITSTPKSLSQHLSYVLEFS